VPGSGFGGGLRRLVTALRLDFNWVRDQTRYGGLAQSWQAGNRADNRLLSGTDIGLAKEWLSRKPRDMPEPPAILRDFIKTSEAVAEARARAEDQRARQLRDAELAAAKAREDAAELEASRAREAEAAARKLSRRTFAGLVAALVLAVAAAGAGSFAWLQWDEAGRQAASADHERQLAEAASRDAKTQATAAKEALALAQTTMSETVDRFTDPAFQHDAALEPLQQAALSKLAPIYLRLLRQAADDPKSNTAYAEAVTRLATLQSSSRSISDATKIFQDALDVLTPADAQGGSAVPREAIDRLRESYAQQLVAFGDAKAAIELVTKIETGQFRTNVDCIRYRADVIQSEVSLSDPAKAEAILDKYKPWRGQGFLHLSNQAACLIDIASVLRHHNEHRAAREALEYAESIISATLKQKPRSIEFLLLDIKQKIAKAWLVYVSAKQSAIEVEDQALADSLITSAKSTRNRLLELAPDSRNAVEAESLLLIFDARLQSLKASVLGDDAAQVGLLDSQLMLGWSTHIAELLNRDPYSEALIALARDVTGTVLGLKSIDSGGNLRKPICRAILKPIFRTLHAHIESRAAWEVALGFVNCLAPLSTAGDGRADHEWLTTSENIPDELIDKALDTIPPSVTRLKILRYAIARAAAMSDMTLLLRLARDEARRHPDTIRFTRLYYFARTSDLDAMVEANNIVEVADRVGDCPAYSKAQQAYCSIATFRVHRSLRDSLRKQTPRPNSSFGDGAFGFLNDSRNTVVTELLSALMPHFVVVLANEEMMYFDDLAYSRKHEDPVEHAWGRELGDKRIVDYASLGRARGMAISDAFDFHFHGPAAIPNSSPDLTHTEEKRGVFLELDAFRETLGFRRHGLLPTAASTDNRVKVDEDLLDIETVILLQGNNVLGEHIFTYLNITFRQLQHMRDALASGEKPDLKNYGRVLYSGYGVPSRAMKKELEEKYSMRSIHVDYRTAFRIKLEHPPYQ